MLCRSVQHRLTIEMWSFIVCYIFNIYICYMFNKITYVGIGIGLSPPRCGIGNMFALTFTYLFLCSSRLCPSRLRNDLLCVEWDVKLY